MKMNVNTPKNKSYADKKGTMLTSNNYHR